MSKQTLLDKAKSIHNGKRVRRNFTAEERELTLAWANNEISQAQVAKVLGMRSSANAYCFLATCLRTIWVERPTVTEINSVAYENYKKNFPLDEPRD